MQFAEHLLLAGQLCLVPGQVYADYMEWFFRISHTFMIPTQACDQPRDAPAADPEDYIQSPSPQVPIAFDPPPHVVRCFARLIFYELLFILNFIINVFNDFDRMVTTDMRRLHRGWSVCSSLG